MRVLHVVKTSDGATWAAKQCGVLVREGVDVHVVVPQPTGTAMALWEQAGATVHVADLSFPTTRPWRLATLTGTVKQLVRRVQPDLIHSHFVSTTLTLRAALGRHHPIPRIFQVPGPLHLENPVTRRAEIRSAGRRDYWLASSDAIRQRYLDSGVRDDRVGVSYYGVDMANRPVPSGGVLHRRLGVPSETRLVGNVNFMYAPKRYLGQTRGLKNHEAVIEALAEVTRSHPDVLGVIVGGAFRTRGKRYEQRMRAMAQKRAGDRIRFTGVLPPDEARNLWPDFTLAVHVPLSENCGGVVEPLDAQVPVVASRVGGLPEVVEDGATGWLVDPLDVPALIRSIEQALDDPSEAQRRAAAGRARVRTMFEVEHTARGVLTHYQKLGYA